MQEFHLKPFLWGLLAGLVIMRIVMTGSVIDLSNLSGTNASSTSCGITCEI